MLGCLLKSRSPQRPPLKLSSSGPPMQGDVRCVILLQELLRLGWQGYSSHWSSCWAAC